MGTATATERPLDMTEMSENLEGVFRKLESLCREHHTESYTYHGGELTPAGRRRLREVARVAGRESERLQDVMHDNRNPFEMVAFAWKAEAALRVIRFVAQRMAAEECFRHEKDHATLLCLAQALHDWTKARQART